MIKDFSVSIVCKDSTFNARFYFEHITDSKISTQKAIWQISDYIKKSLFYL